MRRMDCRRRRQSGASSRVASVGDVPIRLRVLPPKYERLVLALIIGIYHSSCNCAILSQYLSFVNTKCLTRYEATFVL